MAEWAAPSRFIRSFGREAFFAKVLYEQMPAERDLNFSLKVANYLFQQGADRQIVFAAMLGGFSLAEVRNLKNKGTAKHLLEKNASALELDGQASSEFKKDLDGALEIAQSYREIKENLGLDINAQFASGLEYQKLRASLVRAAAMRFELENKESEAETNRNLETAEHVYIPWLDLLGFVGMSNDLGEQWLKIRDPVAYKKISERLEALPSNKRPFGRMISEIKKRLSRRDLKVKDLIFRPKHIYSIYQKLKAYGFPVGSEGFDHDPLRLNDLYGMRVVLAADANESEESQEVKARRALDIIGSSFKQTVNSKVDEYVGANAKPSGYRAIHLPLEGPKNLPVEVHIVTEPWHETNESGTTSHFFYKVATKVNLPLAEKLAKMRDELRAGFSPQQVLKGVGKPLIYVTTDHYGPQEHALPSGATPVDLWYAGSFRRKFEAKIHGRVFLEAAIVSGKRVSLSSPLAYGDHVHFEVSGDPLKVDLLDQLRNSIVTPEAREGLQKLRRKLTGWRLIRRRES